MAALDVYKAEKLAVALESIRLREGVVNRKD
jgi:hypothetical protein